MMRAGRDYITKEGGFVVPDGTTIVVDGRRVGFREFVSSFKGGKIVRQGAGELVIESFKPVASQD